MALGERRIEHFLAAHGRTGLDANISIYFAEGHPRYFPVCHSIFSWLTGGRGTAITATLTWTEVRVQPYRIADESMVFRFELLLRSLPMVEWITPSIAIAERAAELLAIHRLAIAVAILAATALDRGVTGMISNDKHLSRVAGLDVMLLDDVAGE